VVDQMTEAHSVTASDLEFPDCALCGSANHRLVYAGAHDLSQGISGQFAVVRCSNCGLVYLSPRPTPEHLVDYYPAHYGPFLASADPLKFSGRRITALLGRVAVWAYRARFGHEKTTLPPFGRRRMLDVGCGAGSYLQDMQRLGWEVYGVDLSPIAVHAAGKRIGASRVWVGTLETLDPALTDLDLITMNHCLEHLANPRGALGEAYRRLAASGKLKIIVPDVSGFEAKLFGRYWFGLDVPRHLVDFSERTLSACLQQSGFRIESCRPQFWPASVRGSVQHALKWALQVRWHERGELLRGELAKLLLFLGMLSYLAGNRGAIEVVAEKMTWHS
jgi:SAM-dependent methyltransferase